MQLTLKGVVPAPLRQKLLLHKSGIWDRNLVFDKGSHLFVQAPSGTGKTTFVHLLYGTRRDYEGSVTWGGKPIATMSREEMAQLRANNISIVFQDLRLFSGLTALENLEIKRQLTNTTPAATLENYMERLGVADKKNAQAATLSYGEQQRFAIIRALAQPFDWLLMDEPFSHLDHANAQKAMKLIWEVVQQNNAGLLLADLDENNYFPYTQTLQL